MKRLLSVLAAALVAYAPAAHAQQTLSPQAATPVVGGGSFVAAPLLEPGEYRDTILAGENLFYAIDVEAGQSIRVQAELAEDPPENSGLSTFSPVFYTPLREVQRLDLETPEDAEQTVSPGSGGRIDVTNSPVGTLDAAGTDGIIYEGPGTWYVGFTGVYGRSERPPRIETPFMFSLELVGEPVAEPEVEFEEPVRPEPKPKAAAAPATDDGGGSTGLIVGIAAAGLLLGAGAGTVARSRRRGPG